MFHGDLVRDIARMALRKDHPWVDNSSIFLARRCHIEEGVIGYLRDGRKNLGRSSASQSYDFVAGSGEYPSLWYPYWPSFGWKMGMNGQKYTE